jgi:HSP20 family protein
MITRSDPLREAVSLRRAVDQLFEQSFVNPNLMPGSLAQVAPLDACETPNGYEVDIALPGVRPEDIELTVDLNTLTVRGRYSHQEARHQEARQNQIQGQAQQSGQQSQQERAQQPRQGYNWLVREIPSGTFERTMTFPRSIDSNNIQTQFVNGLLTVLLPVSEASRPKRLSVGGGQSQQQQWAVGGRQR